MSPLPRRALLLALLAASTLACHTTSSQPAKKAYTFVFLVTGPKAKEKTPEENQSIMAGHLANIGRLADEGKLLIAGPFDKPVPDARLRGIFILDAPDIETARAWTRTDPGVQAGVFAVELAHFWTDAPLRRSFEAYRAETAELEKSGKKLGMGERVRGYAMILTQDGKRAEQALAAAHGGAKVVFEGDLDGSPRGTFLAILDVKDAAEAAALLGTEGVGEHDLVGWWSAKTVAVISKTAP